jgi:peptidoglycan/xylan/chitin deacetylase (PgdA/CDA1 family)
LRIWPALTSLFIYRGLHGYTHEHVHTLSKRQEEDVLIKSIDVLTKFTGQKPKGWTAPAWSTSPHSIHLLESYGIQYDHSLMHHDSQLYYAPYTSRTWTETNTSSPASTWMTPMANPGISSVVTVPANWHLDDWPPLQPKMATGSGFTDTHVVESLWKEQFEYHYRECPEGGSFVFPISLHPQVSGKPQVILMHERLIEWFKGHEGVEFCTFGEMVGRFKRGEIKGASVEFGG